MKKLKIKTEMLRRNGPVIKPSNWFDNRFDNRLCRVNNNWPIRAQRFPQLVAQITAGCYSDLGCATCCASQQQPMTDVQQKSRSNVEQQKSATRVIRVRWTRLSALRAIVANAFIKQTECWGSPIPVVWMGFGRRVNRQVYCMGPHQIRGTL